MQLFAARVVLFHQAVAERLELSATEFKCFRLVERLGPMSLTTLAHEAGLKLGTVSTLVDRLEANGFVRREKDRSDRRRLVLAAIPEAVERAGKVYRTQSASMARLLDEYVERDFELLIQFLDRVAVILAHSQRALSEIDGPNQVSQ